MATTPPSREDFVAKLVDDPRQPPDTLLLSGFVGKSSDAGHTRLYFDAQLASYVEIPDDAILHRQEMSAEQSPLGGSYLWIKRDAPLIHGPIGPNRRKASFLEGALTQMQANPHIPPPTAPIICAITELPPRCPPHTTPAAGCVVPSTPAAGCPIHTSIAAGCPVPSTPAAGCHPPTSLPGCHPVTSLLCPTQLSIHCQTQFPHCPTFVCPLPQAELAQPAAPLPPQTLLPACQVTLLPGCHTTLTPPCPTHLPALCPTQLPAHCPSIPLATCPTKLPALCHSHLPVFCPPPTGPAVCVTQPVHCLHVTQQVFCQPVSGAAACFASIACPVPSIACGPQGPGQGSF